MAITGIMEIRLMIWGLSGIINLNFDSKAVHAALLFIFKSQLHRRLSIPPKYMARIGAYKNLLLKRCFFPFFNSQNSAYLH